MENSSKKCIHNLCTSQVIGCFKDCHSWTSKVFGTTIPGHKESSYPAKNCKPSSLILAGDSTLQSIVMAIICHDCISQSSNEVGTRRGDHPDDLSSWAPSSAEAPMPCWYLSTGVSGESKTTKRLEVVAINFNHQHRQFEEFRIWKYVLLFLDLARCCLLFLDLACYPPMGLLPSQHMLPMLKYTLSEYLDAIFRLVTESSPVYG